MSFWHALSIATSVLMLIAAINFLIAARAMRRTRAHYEELKRNYQSPTRIIRDLPRR